MEDNVKGSVPVKDATKQGILKCITTTENLACKVGQQGDKDYEADVDLSDRGNKQNFSGVVIRGSKLRLWMVFGFYIDNICRFKQF